MEKKVVVKYFVDGEGWISDSEIIQDTFDSNEYSDDLIVDCCKDYVKDCILNNDTFSDEAKEVALKVADGYEYIVYPVEKDDRATLMYEENGEKVELGKILANHSISVDDALELLDIDMNTFADAQGWDGWNYEALKIEY